MYFLYLIQLVFSRQDCIEKKILKFSQSLLQTQCWTKVQTNKLNIHDVKKGTFEAPAKVQEPQGYLE